MVSDAGNRPDVEPAMVEACRRGDRLALDRVLRSNIPAIEGLIVRLLGPGADVEDVLQNTLVAAVRSFPQFRGEASVRTWLTRIAVNVARDHLRHPHQRRVLLQVVSAEDEQLAPHLGPDRLLMQRECLDRLYHYLSRLGPKNRIAFMLHVFEGHSIDEVAALTGATPAATKSRVFLARRSLLKRAAKDPALRELIAAKEKRR